MKIDLPKSWNRKDNPLYTFTKTKIQRGAMCFVQHFEVNVYYDPLKELWTVMAACEGIILVQCELDNITEVQDAVKGFIAKVEDGEI